MCPVFPPRVSKGAWQPPAPKGNTHAPKGNTPCPKGEHPLSPNGNRPYLSRNTVHCVRSRSAFQFSQFQIILCGYPFQEIKTSRGYIAKTGLSYIFGFVYAGPNYIGLCHSKQGRICSPCFPGHPIPIQWSATDCSPLWTPLFPFGATPVPHWGMPAPKGNTL